MVIIPFFRVPHWMSITNGFILSQNIVNKMARQKLKSDLEANKFLVLVNIWKITNIQLFANILMFYELHIYS